MSANLSHIRQYLKQFDFRKLFIEELGWDRFSGALEIPIDGQTFRLSAIAQKRSMGVWLCEPDAEGNIPQQAILVKLERQVTKRSFEHLIVYHNKAKTQQLWQFAKRIAGKPTYRTHRFDINQSGESLAQKLSQMAFSLDEEEQTTLIDVTRKASAAFYVEKVTKRFYEEFQKQHDQLLKFIKGIPEEQLQRWYASVMLNRLMFIYFIQKKNFLNNDVNYLRIKLQESKAKGKDQFYHSFLVKLFFEGFAKKQQDRSAATNKLLGAIPYLNGGLFLPHQIEEKYGKKIEIADKVFDHLFEYFDRYQWHLDERPLKDDLEINPDVLGYIFEKYINQKEMGAYYTKEDITGYNSQYTIIPRIFDIAKEKCAIAFEGEHSFWNLLKADPNRYIYEAVKKGTNLDLPINISAGINDVSKRTEWNKTADPEYALPTEIWREVVARRQRCQDVYIKLANGEIHEINDFITYNLDIRQFAQDVIENCEGSDLLAAFWFAIEKLTVLDPTCGSGAFLFAALNILELLYEACLDRMQDFVDSVLPAMPADGKQASSTTGEKYAEFRSVLDRITKHPNQRYFIYKSIIVNNLFGVDIMEEAVEICKLRLFLKLVAQVESVTQIEPLPDIDFNIRAGNTLVGFARMEDYDKLFGVPLGFESGVSVMARKVAQMQSEFSRQQLEDGSGSEDLKKDIKKQLEALAVHFDQELALAYGFFPRKIADKTKTEKLSEFKETHKPFHWCIEFFDIIAKGGFDVVVGNPPFIEYNKVKRNYTVKDYDTEKCGNLYAFVFERSESLLLGSGRIGMIFPIAMISVSETATARSMISRCFGFAWTANFAIRPAKLFDGVEQRLSIFLAKHDRVAIAQLYSTKYNQWYIDERPTLFSKLEYGNVPILPHDECFAKTGNSEAASIVNKVRNHYDNVVGKELAENSKNKLWFHRTPGYWIRIMDFEPYFRSPQGNRSIHHIRELHFTDKTKSKYSGAIISSSLYFFWFFALGNCRNLTLEDVKQFPIGIPSSEVLEGSSKLFTKLMNDFQKNSFISKRGDSEFQEFEWGASKPIIDEIDRVLAMHYGFTDEELDFIINYDIKYRMGRNNEEEE